MIGTMVKERTWDADVVARAGEKVHLRIVMWHTLGWDCAPFGVWVRRSASNCYRSREFR
jgi:hypothetical protein